MKSKLLILIIFALVSTTVNAADYIPVKLIDTNGKERTGYAKRIKTGPVKHVLFKTTKDAKKQKIPCDNLETIIYSYPNGDVEYDRMKAYKGAWYKKTSKKEYWLEVVKRDYLTVYYGEKKTPTYSGGMRMPMEERYWFFHRKGEDGVTLVALTGVINANSIFKKAASRYLKDYPELAAKIKNKEYKWKDLDEVAELYNKWYAQKTN